MELTRKIKVVAGILLSVWLCVSCEKTNTYFEDFDPKTNVYDGSIFSYLETQSGVYDSLVYILDRLPTLREKLKDVGGEYTLFALNNRSIELSFSSLNNIRRATNRPLLGIEDLDVVELDSMMSKYIFPKAILTSDISQLSDGVLENSVYGYPMHVQYGETSASGLIGFGPQELVFSDPNNSPFHFEWTRTTTRSINIQTRNGVVHVLAPGHDFGFDKFVTAFNN